MFKVESYKFSTDKRLTRFKLNVPFDTISFDCFALRKHYSRSGSPYLGLPSSVF